MNVGIEGIGVTFKSGQGQCSLALGRFGTYDDGLIDLETGSEVSSANAAYCTNLGEPTTWRAGNPVLKEGLSPERFDESAALGLIESDRKSVV